MSGKPLLRALTAAASARPPIWLMRQAGRYLPEYRRLRRQAPSFIHFCLSPELAVEATLQPIRRFAMDGAILFSDILLIPYALGQPVEFRDGIGPVLGDLDRASGEAESVTARLEPVYAAVRGVTARLPADVTLLGFAGAPWTVAAYMVEGRSSRDFAAVKAMAYGAPDRFGSLVARLTEATIEHLSAQIAAGAEAVKLFDSWAGVLNEAGFERWVLEPTRTITEALKQRHPGVPVIGFPRGCGVLYRHFAAESGVDCVALDSAVPLGWAVDRLDGRVALQGNLDPVMLLAGDAPLAVAVDRILRIAEGRRFVFNLGHGVLPATPPARVGRLVRRVRGEREG